MTQHLEPETARCVAELDEWCAQLRTQADEAPDAMVETSDQLAVENLIASGIAILAGEEAPEPATRASDRPILAKDLLITADLVGRALQAHA